MTCISKNYVSPLSIIGQRCQASPSVGDKAKLMDITDESSIIFPTKNYDFDIRYRQLSMVTIVNWSVLITFEGEGLAIKEFAGFRVSLSS
jgi:hypothetical protein